MKPNVVEQGEDGGKRGAGRGAAEGNAPISGSLVLARQSRQWWQQYGRGTSGELVVPCTRRIVQEKRMRRVLRCCLVVLKWALRHVFCQAAWRREQGCAPGVPGEGGERVRLN